MVWYNERVYRASSSSSKILLFFSEVLTSQYKGGKATFPFSKTSILNPFD